MRNSCWDVLLQFYCAKLEFPAFTRDRRWKSGWSTREIPGIIASPGYQRTTGGLTWSRRARTAEMLLTEPGNGPGGEASGLPIGERAKIPGISLEKLE